MTRAPREYVCGVHAVLAALERGAGRAVRLYIARGRGGAPAARAQALAEGAGLPVEAVAGGRLDGLAGSGQHQGLVAEVHPTLILDIVALLAAQPPEKPPLLLMDGIQDPRNLGALLRTAAALGAGGAVWPKSGAAGLTPTVSKAAAGALETLPLARVTNMARAVEAVKEAGYWAVAADPEGEGVLGEAEIPAPLALVVGAEGKGVRRLVREKCDLGVRIPMGEGIMSSLNVAVATGILLFAAPRPPFSPGSD